MQNSNKSQSITELSTGRAALIAGLGLLVMVVTAPVAEMYLLPNLIERGDAAQTFENIAAQKPKFVVVIFLYLITFIADVIVAWALYIFFKPVYKSLSLLTAWFRLVYTVLALFGLFNLLKVLQLTSQESGISLINNDHSMGQVMFYLQSFRQEWGIAFIFFGICLALLGYLAYKAQYVPKIIGLLLLIAGLGYILNSLQPYFYPELDTSFLMITFFGEIVFMIWLLIKGRRISL